MLTPNLNTTWMFHFFHWNGWCCQCECILWELIRLWSLKSISRQLKIYFKQRHLHFYRMLQSLSLSCEFSVISFELHYLSSSVGLILLLRALILMPTTIFNGYIVQLTQNTVYSLRFYINKKKLVKMNETNKKTSQHEWDEQKKKNSMTQWNARIVQVLSGTWTFKSEDFMHSPLVDWIPPAVNTQAWCLIAQIKANRNNIVLQHRMGPNANNNIFLFKCNIIFFCLNRQFFLLSFKIIQINTIERRKKRFEIQIQW